MATFYVPNETGWEKSGYSQWIRFVVDQSYNSAANTSTLSIKLQYKGRTGTQMISNNNAYAKAGSTNLFDPLSGKMFWPAYADEWNDLRDNNNNVLPAQTYTLSHNSDGNASLAFSIYIRIGTLIWENSATLSLSNTPSYTLSISQGTGSTVSVLRGSTALSNGAQVYRNESLTVNFSASTGYALGTHTVNGTTRNSGYSHTVTGAVSVVATASVLSYTLSISTGTGSTVSVSRTSSPKQSAATGALSNGATVYYSDVLKISFGAATGYDLATHTVNGSTFTSGNSHTVTGAVSVVATASASTSTISASNGNFGQAVAITVTRRSNSYTHTVTTSCLGQTETIINKGTSTSLSWTPALATYAPLIPNAMSASATITCTTYNGNTAVGTHTISITLSLRAQDVKPTVAIAVADPLGYATTYEGFVATKSKIRVTLTNTLKYGATLKTTAITANGESFSASPATTGLITSTSNTSVTAAITDSRGQSSGTQSTTITILAYTQPKINSFSVHRSDGNGTLDESGAYMRVDYNVAITALNNHNTKTLEVKYKKRSVSTWSTQSVSMSAYTASGSVIIAADTESTYDVQLSLADAFQTTSITTQLSSAHVYPMNFKTGGKGVAFGKVSEIDKSVEIAEDWTLYNGTKKIRPEALNLGTADAFIHANDNFNDYIYPGVFSVYLNTIAESASNCPSSRAGILRVWNANGNDRGPGDSWYYVAQEYITIDGDIWIRTGNSTSEPTVIWDDWHRPISADSGSNYCKMADGTLICWGAITISNVPITTQWGSLYESAIQSSGVTFPIPFIASPCVVAFASVSPTAWLENMGSDITRLGSFYLVRPTQSSGSNGYVFWQAIGRWKA